MRYKPEAIRWIDARADALVEGLGRFRTPGSGDPVAPSLVGVLYRTARACPTLDDLERVLKLYPSSAAARRSNASGPQAQHLCAEVLKLVAEVREGTSVGRWRAAEEARALAAILGLTLRGLKTARGQTAA